MKIIHISYADTVGGAHIAANRIHKALIEEGISSKQWVNKAFSDDHTVQSPLTITEKLLNNLKPILINRTLVKMLKSKNKIINSPSVFPSAWTKRINESDADIIHLHWIQKEMLSIKDISKIKKPIVWTLHDMWAFCGAEHYTMDNRWREGYSYTNRPSYESGIDLNHWTWKRKQKHWRSPIQITTPSKWLANCVKESKLMSNWPVSVIANPLKMDIFKPINKKIARDQLNLPLDKKLILFGAVDGIKDYRKGFDLLFGSLEYLKNYSSTSRFELVIFGQKKSKTPLNLDLPIHYLGKITNDKNLSLIYNSADLIVVPSRQDNLPNVCLEAQACGLPIVAFNIGGLIDIVDHKKTGYLAKAFDIKDLANGINFVLDHTNSNELRENIHLKASEKYSPKIISKKFKSVYEKILKR
jgi:glycosyltransferase involved in cell wall biosynthesis